jgi:hypothetical protein
MNEVVYYGIRAWLAVREFCGCSRKKPAVDVSAPPTTTWGFGERFNIQVLNYSNGRTKRRVFHQGGEKENKTEVNYSVFPPSPPPPWFFIGSYESAKGLEDKTYEMDEYVYPGNVITLELLRELFPGTQRWVYIHPQTFEETDFPSEGIVIGNDKNGCSH